MSRSTKSRLSRFGFRLDASGAHTARTVMLAELTALLAAVPNPEATRADYARAVVEENCLGKRSGKTRVLSLKHLTELYSLDASDLLFRALRYYWDRDPAGRPLLAVLCAVTRDQLLRESAAKILKSPQGATFTTADMEAFIEQKHPGRFSSATLTSTAQNLNSSWTKAGHLRGVTRKVRTRPTATAGAAAFALLLGFLSGARGTRLFETEYFRLLECSSGSGFDLAEEAANRGWMTLFRVQDVLEVHFHQLLTAQEKEWLRE